MRTINSNRLRELRQQKRFSREQLSSRSKVSVRQLARLEDRSNAFGSARDTTIHRLAEALDIDPRVLTGELPMPKPSTPPPGKPVQVSALLGPEIRLAYALIERRYGVNARTLFNAAPLLFVLLAEGSLLWRREELRKLEEAAGQFFGQKSGHLRFLSEEQEIYSALDEEDDSITGCDIFGRNVGSTGFDARYDRSKENPFADYLQHLARRIDDPAVVSVNEEGLAHGVLKNFPRFEVCAGDLKQIAGQSETAIYALERGDARISDIPDELWADDATGKRARWLEDKLPEYVSDFLAGFDSPGTDETEASQ